MYKLITGTLAIIIFSVSTVPTQAGELKLGKSLSIEQHSAPDQSTAESRIDKLAKPYDDIEISDELSAGIISERDDSNIENNHRTPTREKDTEVGVGLSFSF